MIATRSPTVDAGDAGAARHLAGESWPRIWGFCAPVSGCGSTGVTIGPAMYSCRSVPQIPQVATRTTTSPAPAPGLGDVLDAQVAGGVETQRLSRHDLLGPQSSEEIE